MAVAYAVTRFMSGRMMHRSTTLSHVRHRRRVSRMDRVEAPVVSSCSKTHSTTSSFCHIPACVAHQFRRDARGRIERDDDVVGGTSSATRGWVCVCVWAYQITGCCSIPCPR